MYKAIMTNASTLIPEIREVDFKIKGDWIYVTKGGITGFESAEIKNLIKRYLERSIFSSWIACMGTLGVYHRLEIPISEIIKFLENEGLIEVKKSYGYPKEIIWLPHSSAPTANEVKT